VADGGDAAEWVTFVEEVGRDCGGVATVGHLAAAPGASNVIAGEATATLDVRDENDAVRATALAEILEGGRTIAARRGVTFEVLEAAACDHATVPMDRRLTALLRTAAGGDDTPLLPSGAGHDAAVMAAVMPAAMLFLRSPGGVSHHPDERVYAADVERALRAVLRFVEAIAAT
jgi:allantoate deiminase